MPALRSITYVSTPTRPVNVQDLESLLAEARDFNRINEITGVLLFSGTRFMQCFEGPDDTVQKVYERILSSSKHKDVLVMMDEPIDKRTFGDWLMGSATATESDLLKLYTARWSKRNDEPALASVIPPGLGMLQVFWGMRPT